MNDAPIGIFDSGVGGLTVARAISELLPHESFIYVGDTAHTPYGPRSVEEVRRFSFQILDDLVARGVKMLVIACNTASVAILSEARLRYSVPVVEVVQPAVRAALATTRNGRIGVIGTEGTISSEVYQNLLQLQNGASEVTSVACARFVEFVEAGDTGSAEVIDTARQYLEPLISAGVDTLVLGCTHYPFLQGAISYVMGPRVTLVTSNTETAKDVYRSLIEMDALAPADQEPVRVYEATGESEYAFVSLAQRLMGRGVNEVRLVHTGVLDLPQD